jgi:hypothetical protein
VSERGFSPQEIFAALDRHGVDYVTIGGVAANAHGSRRLTLDVDIVPAPEESNYERLAAALDELGAFVSGRSRSRSEALRCGSPRSTT